jgi:uncharacterized OsmC-like protein
METAVMQNIVNGVNVENLLTSIYAFKQQPALAKFKFRATNKWITGGHNRSRIKEFYGAGQEDSQRTQTFVLDADEPALLHSGDRGANPAEFVLHALAACLTTSMVYHAAARGIRIEELDSKVEGDIDVRGFTGAESSVRKGYQNIRVTMRCKSDATAEQLEELSKFSPVWDTIQNPVPVTVRVEKK